MLELALDVREQRRRPEPEQIGSQPALAQLFLHEDEPVERLFRLADPARRLEADGASGALVIVADLPRHDHADGEGRDRKSTRLNSSHQIISYAVFCLKKKKKNSSSSWSSISTRYRKSPEGTTGMNG